MYVSPNFKTKKELKQAVKDSLANNAKGVTVYAPGLGTIPRNGLVSLEGPHYPAPHTWYAEGTMRDGILIAIK